MPDSFAHQPQALWLRRALFQVHLWTGIAIGLYVALISLTGSLMAYRREIDKLCCPRIVLIAPHGERLGGGALLAAARAAYPRLARRARITVRGPRVPGAAVEIWYEFGNRRLERLFDPYTGRNLGDTVAREPGWVSRVADLHDELLAGDTGLAVNGAAA